MESNCTKKKSKKGIPHHRISYEERKLIEKMLDERCPTKDIASVVGCGVQALYKEVSRGYDANKAQAKVGCR